MPLATESDLRYALEVIRNVAVRVVGEAMTAPARRYEVILAEAGLNVPVSPEPETFLFLDASSMHVIIRYLVDARQRRKWKPQLILELLEELRTPAHADRIIGALPRQQLQLLDTDGAPADWVPITRAASDR